MNGRRPSKKTRARLAGIFRPSAPMKTPALLERCLNCGGKGPHFAPPGFGTEGVYVCEPAVDDVSSALKAVGTVLAGAMAVAGLGGCGPQPAEPVPAPVPVSAVEAWCVNAQTMTLIDMPPCTQDLDFDGYLDGHLVVPPRGMTKPAKGQRLPATIILNTAPARVISIPGGPGPRPQIKPTTASKPSSSWSSRRKSG